MNNAIVTKPEPYCLICGAKMVLRRPKSDQSWKPFWGCNRFPDCRGTRQIDLKTGKVKDDVEENLDYLDYLDYDDSWHPGHPSNYGDN